MDHLLIQTTFYRSPGVCIVIEPTYKDHLCKEHIFLIPRVVFIHKFRCILIMFLQFLMLPLGHFLPPPPPLLLLPLLQSACENWSQLKIWPVFDLDSFLLWPSLASFRGKHNVNSLFVSKWMHIYIKMPIYAIYFKHAVTPQNFWE